ncbi:hypothetical protein LTR10_017810 [Elasticomyces elasticus]|uniref:Calcineurin-like phosphoesterase domain-containing protein n=1 Tax=Exophiala sideris TaxID=1016849 RepID=A0ABR0JCX6_9EURO|nr:hypothetical protein LTR10_017810 [Elasticomyces elasticus]KAK5031320.1 hypothetical protein LTS07_005055 [Exophiala sideris]KAK5039040.1 hypothetical protein LTR13_004071 [Exophiala sideris]KAK5060925.1 hypothetical protein LTR69_005524 [Exophiala sideris]KAK5183836.1 hypothetical protein LTR44_004118 [Eurotiomycetes sp. CCFEE 6388]
MLVGDASIVTAIGDTLAQRWPFSRTIDASDVPSIPFRLLVLADPQLEGDSSLPKPEDAFLAKQARRWRELGAQEKGDILPLLLENLQGLVLEDLLEWIQSLRKKLDLFGNDYYLGHVYRTLHWWTVPSHVTVLGDLIGSQWVTDEEFEWRGWRYWNRVFANGQQIGEEITSYNEAGKERTFALTEASWSNNIINIAGNHDVGYAGEISDKRMERFERVFGKANWDVRFQYPESNNTVGSIDTVPSLHLIVLNSLILDSPALSEDLQGETFAYLNSLISHRLRPVEDQSSFTLLLTHLPLHKKEGTCVDAPFFDYWGDDDGGGVYRPHGVREQNHLSTHVSRQGILKTLFGMSGDLNAPAQGQGRQGLILTGHDHEGCDVWHYIPSNSTWSDSEEHSDDDTETQWDAVRWTHEDSVNSHTGIREITLRSMMGDYGGNAGLLSAWFDFEAGQWKYAIQRCGLDVKVWWAVHVVDLIVIALSAVSLVYHMLFAIRLPASGSKQPPSPPKHLAVKLKG